MRFRWRLSALLALLAATLWAFFAVPFRTVRVAGDSMYPTFHSGQILFASKHRASIHVGEIVIFAMGDEVYIKRVCAMPGQTVRLYKRPGGEWKVAHDPDVVRSFELGLTTTRFEWKDEVVPIGRIWVEGDNYKTGLGSANYGCIPLEDVLATVPGPNPPTMRDEDV